MIDKLTRFSFRHELPTPKITTHLPLPLYKPWPWEESDTKLLLPS